MTKRTNTATLKIILHIKFTTHSKEIYKPNKKSTFLHKTKSGIKSLPLPSHPPRKHKHQQQQSLAPPPVTAVDDKGQLAFPTTVPSILSSSSLIQYCSNPSAREMFYHYFTDSMYNNIFPLT